MFSVIVLKYFNGRYWDRKNQPNGALVVDIPVTHVPFVVAAAVR